MLRKVSDRIVKTYLSSLQLSEIDLRININIRGKGAFSGNLPASQHTSNHCRWNAGPVLCTVEILIRPGKYISRIFYLLTVFHP